MSLIKLLGKTNFQGKTIFATDLTPTYTITSNVASVNEGSSVTFTLSTTNVANGTVLPYTITGVSLADLASGALTGNFTVASGIATASITLAADALTEGAETMTVTLSSGVASASVLVNDTSLTPTYTITRSASSVNEGSAVTFTLTTTDVANGTVLPYTISGISANDVTSGSLTGSFTINNGSATTTITMSADQLTEGAETATLTLNNGAASNFVVVNDTSTTDSDALTYINAVEAADGQALELAVRSAINNFVVGCKSDGIWTALKASCILAGARTLNGALVPLVGTAPTNANFVSADYNRKTGLKGNGTTKYLNSNRNNNADPQNSQHISVYQTELSTAGGNNARLISGRAASTPTGSTQISCVYYDNTNDIYSRYNGTLWSFSPRSSAPKFIGCSRGSSASYQYRVNNTTLTRNDTSAAPSSVNFLIFTDPRLTSTFYSNARINFYSIGESLNLALLNTRVSALMTALSTAI